MDVSGTDRDLSREHPSYHRHHQGVTANHNHNNNNINNNNNNNNNNEDTDTGSSASQESRLICEICHADYRLTMRGEFMFSWQRCCTIRSVGHACELIILFALLCLFIVFCSILGMGDEGGDDENDDDNKRKDPVFENSTLLLVITAIMGVLTLVTMYQVWKRWKKANSIRVIQSQSGRHNVL
jgi:hypothetical protein